MKKVKVMWSLDTVANLWSLEPGSPEHDWKEAVLTLVDFSKSSTTEFLLDDEASLKDLLSVWKHAD